MVYAARHLHISGSTVNGHWCSNPLLSGEIHLPCGPRLSAGSKWRSMVPGGAGTNHAVATLPSGAPLHLAASWPLSAYCEQRQRIVSSRALFWSTMEYLVAQAGVCGHRVLLIGDTNSALVGGRWGYSPWSKTQSVDRETDA